MLSARSHRRVSGLSAKVTFESSPHLHTRSIDQRLRPQAFLRVVTQCADARGALARDGGDGGDALVRGRLASLAMLHIGQTLETSFESLNFVAR